MDRRGWLKSLAAVGIGGSVFQRALASGAQDTAEISAEMIKQAQWVAGVELTDDEVDGLVSSLKRKQLSWQQIKEIKIDPSEAPTVHFQPLTGRRVKDENATGIVFTADRMVSRPASDDDLAFMSIDELGSLIFSRKITSVELTKVYLQRLKKFDPLLNCVVTLTEDLAMQQAKRADKEISEGRYLGPLHGIAWGAKDLIAVKGYPTTWGAPQFKQQIIDQEATVYQRLTDAGAVLVAKLSLGALAMGDQWFEGMTRNPWDPQRGSSGSSAGSASAVAAGLVGFAIGTETLGSILSPSRVCGTVGLRPTFGAVSRAGCMPLSWTMDKVGPITRYVRDAAYVFAAIVGQDGKDATVEHANFSYPKSIDPAQIRIGYVADTRRGDEEREDLKILRELGYQLVEVKLPTQLPAGPLTMVLEVEGASVFEHWLNQADTEGWNAWPGIFRSAQFVTAVDYLRAQRLRGRLIRQMEELFDQVDLLVNANDLVITNLTGHPSATFPYQYVQRQGKEYPRPCVLTGRLFDEGLLCAVAWSMQQRLDTLGKRPTIDKFLDEQNAAPTEPDTSEIKPDSEAANPDAAKTEGGKPEGGKPESVGGIAG